jgi:hypothetical protein
MGICNLIAYQSYLARGIFMYDLEWRDDFRIMNYDGLHIRGVLRKGNYLITQGGTEWELVV